jgi:hypothetical protein
MELNYVMENKMDTNGVVLFIPHVYSTFSKEYISSILGLFGKITNIEFSKTKKYKTHKIRNAFIYYKPNTFNIEWRNKKYPNLSKHEHLNDLCDSFYKDLQSNNVIKIKHQQNKPWYWSVMISKQPHRFKRVFKGKKDRAFSLWIPTIEKKRCFNTMNKIIERKQMEMGFLSLKHNANMYNMYMEDDITFINGYSTKLVDNIVDNAIKNVINKSKIPETEEVVKNKKNCIIQ